jgi:aldehyde oxidoreductase
MALKKITLNINGVDRPILCDPQKDSLADVIRRIGLTGAKIGCNAGQCGACSIIMDGNVMRSCIKKMKDIHDHAKIETIEGLGSKECLHPLQQAFITYNGVQCGFCSPGFIMSAKCLLNSNPSPTREEARDWFTVHRNVCRCTGYKPIIDAVMAAAAVMRGEKTMDDIIFKIPPDGKIYGTDHPKPTALAKVLGVCDYGDDLSLKMPEGTLHLAMVTSRISHGNIKSIDYSAVLNMAGVYKVVTAGDVKGTNRMFAPLPGPRNLASGRERPVICDKKVFRYGDVVAVVAADSRREAREAAKAVVVEYEQLPEYLNYIDATAPDAMQIHDGTPNLYLEQPLFKGEDTGDVFSSAAYVVSGSFYSTREPHLPIEPDTVQAYWDENGFITIHCKSQNLFGNIMNISEAIGVPKDKIRIIQNPVGGSFGYTMSAASFALAAVCAIALDRPVSLTMSYAEHQHFTGKRSPSYVNAGLACDSQGRITGLEFNMGIDHGAYSDLAANLTSKAARFFGYPYNVPNIRGLVRTCFSNHNHGIAYRAFGSPQCYTASEALMDMMAERIGMDPFEFRFLNVAKEGDDCPNAVPYREFPMRQMMELMRPVYQAALARAKKESASRKKRGVGVAWGGYHVGKCPDHSEVALELNPDGTVTNFNCWEDMGQGADVGALVHTHECLRSLGLQPNQIKLVQNDTLICPETGPASASRSHHVAGMATLDASKKLLAAMRKSDGSFRTYAEMIAEKIPTKYMGSYDTVGAWEDIDPNTGHGYGAFAQNYILVIAEVEVDVATGKTKVLAINAMADVGIIGSPPSVLGQAYGGIAHSIGFALKENYDDPQKHASLVGAGIAFCDDIPDDLNVIFHETPRENGPHGSTGCSEAFQSSGHMAVINAINNAIGTRIYTLPATPEKIKAAIASKEKGLGLIPEPWDLHCDLHERLAWLKANPVPVE